MRSTDLSRREFIGRAALAAAGLSLASPSRTYAAQAQGRGSIDVHHHYLPPGYIEFARDYVAKTSPGMQSVFAVPWTPARSIDEMDRLGIATAIVSISAPGVSFAGAPTAVRLSRSRTTMVRQ